MAEWYALSSQETIDELQSRLSGLTTAEARQRLAQYGENKLPEKRVEPLWLIFLKQFHSPLIYILLLAGILVYFLHGFLDSAIILSVLIFNAVIGAYQEGQARQTMQALKRFLRTKATVLREGQKLIVTDNHLVPGDILLLSEGEQVPADARLISTNNLAVDESSLSGESVPVHKMSQVLHGHLTLADQKNLVFKGTYILSGTGKAVVTATGPKTQIGSISTALAGEQSDVPLKHEVSKLSTIIITITGLAGIFLLGIGLITGEEPATMLSTVISLAVSVIPEGLPVVLTVILATGVWRMSKQNALVKRIQAVEGLGQIDVIAVDKTGTITKNQMTLAEVYLDGKVYSVSGTGYGPEGKITHEGKELKGHQGAVMQAAQVAALCSSAHVTLSPKAHEWLVTGDPTEAALQVFARKLGIEREELLRSYPLVKELPFDYRTKYHACLVKKEGQHFLAVSGAPEIVLENCRLSEKEKETILAQLHAFSSRGLRVVAFAWQNQEESQLKHPLPELRFGGLFGLKDPLHEEVPATVARVHAAGIKVVLITGDHKITARAIAQEAGIFHEGDEILTGEDIERLTPAELQHRITKVSVFARVTPDQKLSIVHAYQAAGRLIAMTGDGVNDAPSLAGADLGIAMGKIGTEVAKEAADIILLDDNFRSIVSAVEEGRSIYRTLKRVILYLFSTSVGEATVVIFALLIGFPLPLHPSQIIWLNFVTDGFLTAALAMEPKEEGLLRAKKTEFKHLIDRGLIAQTFLMGGLMASISLLLFSHYSVEDLVKASTVAMTSLAIVQWYFAWTIRSEEPLFSGETRGNRYLVAATVTVVILQIMAVYIPAFQGVLHTTALNFTDWMIIGFTSTAVPLADQMKKWLQGSHSS